MHVKIGPPIHVMLYLPVVVNRVNTRVLLQLFWLSLPLCPEFLTSSPCPPITSHNTSDKGRIKCVCECQSEKNWGKGQTGGKKCSGTLILTAWTTMGKDNVKATHTYTYTFIF